MIYLWFLTHMLSKSHLTVTSKYYAREPGKALKVKKRDEKHTEKRVHFNIVTAKVKRKHYKWGNSLYLIERNASIQEN